ncbi:hypothetical protein C8R48DRAFT_442664 [Suillus tomentosus]|nr:hypothetical protein C8R48DRAFT_442664 [Suillus tomentosus]
MTGQDTIPLGKSLRTTANNSTKSVLIPKRTVAIIPLAALNHSARADVQTSR